MPKIPFSQKDRLLAVEIVTVAAFLAWGVPLGLGIMLGGATVTVYDWTAFIVIVTVAGLCELAEKKRAAAI